MAATNHWTRDQLLIAFTLYSQLPFGRLHSRNPDIIRYAELINRTPSALAMKLVNLASLDPFIINSGRTGLRGASNADRALWQEMGSNPELFEQQCQQAMVSLEAGAAEAITAPSPLQANDSEIPNYHGGERLTQVKTRIGQQLFRKNAYSATTANAAALLDWKNLRYWSPAIFNRGKRQKNIASIPATVSACPTYTTKPLIWDSSASTTRWKCCFRHASKS